MTTAEMEILRQSDEFQKQDAKRLDAALKRLLDDEDFRFVSLWLLRTVCGIYDRVDGMTDHADFVGRHNAGIDIMDALNRADASKVLLSLIERNAEECRRKAILDEISKKNQGVNE